MVLRDPCEVALDPQKGLRTHIENYRFRSFLSKKLSQMEDLIAQTQVENIKKSQAPVCPAHGKTEPPSQQGQERLNFLSSSQLHPFFTRPPSLQGPHTV